MYFDTRFASDGGTVAGVDFYAVDGDGPLGGYQITVSVRAVKFIDDGVPFSTVAPNTREGVRMGRASLSLSKPLARTVNCSERSSFGKRRVPQEGGWLRVSGRIQIWNSWVSSLSWLYSE